MKIAWRRMYFQVINTKEKIVDLKVKQRWYTLDDDVIDITRVEVKDTEDRCLCSSVIEVLMNIVYIEVGYILKYF